VARGQKVISEIFLTRLLATKVTENLCYSAENAQCSVILHEVFIACFQPFYVLYVQCLWLGSAFNL